jgi:hypothetical protein
MVELAIGVAAFLFLCWVAIQGFFLICTVFEAMAEHKVLGLFALTVVLLLVGWLL